jgi:L-lactate permease
LVVTCRRRARSAITIASSVDCSALWSNSDSAARWFNHEGDILRSVFYQSTALACLVGVFVTLQAYVWPFTLRVVR